LELRELARDTPRLERLARVSQATEAVRTLGHIGATDTLWRLAADQSYCYRGMAESELRKRSGEGRAAGRRKPWVLKRITFGDEFVRENLWVGSGISSEGRGGIVRRLSQAGSGSLRWLLAPVSGYCARAVSPGHCGSFPIAGATGVPVVLSYTSFITSSPPSGFVTTTRNKGVFFDRYLEIERRRRGGDLSEDEVTWTEPLAEYRSSTGR